MTKITVETEEYHQTGTLGPFADRSVDEGYILLPGTSFTEYGNQNTYDGEWYAVVRTQYGNLPHVFKRRGRNWTTETFHQRSEELLAFLKESAKKPSSNP